jgi:hypothetical protein
MFVSGGPCSGAARWRRWRRGGGYSGITKYYDFGNARYGVSFAGTNTDGTNITALGQKLSGTMVEFVLTVSTLKIGVIPGQDPPPPPVHDASTITNIKVYLLGGASQDDTLPSQFSDVDFPCGVGQAYRLSSTYFQHGTAINIRVTATFSFQHPLYEGRTSTVINYDETFNFVAYNYLARVGTPYKNVNGTPVWDQTFNNVSTSILGQSTKLQNHLRNPSSVPTALALDKAALLPLTKPGTAFVSASHGDPSFVYDSYAVTADANHVIQAVNQAGGEGVNVEVAAKASPYIPGYNLLAFYACKTLLNGAGTNITSGFGITGLDRAHLGFDGKVHNFLRQKSDGAIDLSHTLDEHAYRLFTALSQGRTVGQALEDSQGQQETHEPGDADTITYSGGQFVISRLPMKIVGDSLARTWFVYLTLQEREHLDNKGQTLDRHFVKLPVNTSY